MGRGQRSPDGLRFVSTSGYRIVIVNGKPTYEHRLVMESHLGRPLLRTELVHHIDHNKLNNNVTNLKLVTSRTHGEEHSTFPKEKTCEWCGKLYIPSPANRRTQKYCGHVCKGYAKGVYYPRQRKLTDEQIDEIITKLANGIPNKDLAVEYGVSRSKITMIKQGQYKKRGT